MTIGVVALIGYGLWSASKAEESRRATLGDLGDAPITAAPAPVVGEGDVIELLEASEQGRVPLYTPTGDLAQILYYERFEPQQAGRFHVDRPRALIRLNDGRTIEIRSASADFVRRQSNREPESGRFRGDVELHILDAVLTEDVADDEDWRPSPTLSIYTSTLDFDSVIGELRMDDTVQIRAPGVASDGEGVTIVFSEQDRRLLYLRLARSHGVTIDPKAMGSESSEQPASSEPAPPPTIATAPTREDFYRADFAGPVRVESGPRTLDAERLELWARLVDGRLRPDAIAPIDWAEPVARTETAPSEGAGESESQSLAEPIRIAWSGPLEIRPLQGAPRELNLDDLFVRFAAPQDGLVRMADSTLRGLLSGATLEYGATSRLATLTGLGPQGVVARVEDRAEVVTQRLEFDAARGVISAPGPGLARAIGASLDRAGRDESGAAPARDLSWRGRCDISLAALAEGDVTVERVEFFEQVLARDGDTTARAERIGAEFEPGPDGGPALARLSLEGGARADAGPEGLITAQRIDVLFDPGAPQNDLTPTLATASGAVFASRDNVRLRADLVEATLAPDAGGSPEVTLLTADLGVIVEIDQGGELIEARADHLRAVPATETAELTGDLASIRRGLGVVRASSMRLEGAARRLTAFGAGVAEQTAPDGGDVLGYDHVKAEWTRSLTFDDVAGVTEVVGEVVVTGETGAHAIDTAKGERLVIDFVPGASEESVSSDARVLRATLIGASEEVEGGAHSEVEGRRYVADDTQDTGRRLETMLYLTAARIVFDAEREAMIAPGAGRLLVEDRRESGDGAGDANGPLARGTTLFDWEGSLEMNRRSGTAVMQTGVRLRQRPPGANEVAELECETLEAIFSEIERRLLRAEAQGGIYLHHRTRHVTADKLLYDALTGVAILDAWEGNVVTYHDDARAGSQRAGSITWNLVTDDIRVDRASPITIPR